MCPECWKRPSSINNQLIHKANLKSDHDTNNRIKICRRKDDIGEVSLACRGFSMMSKKRKTVTYGNMNADLLKNNIWLYFLFFFSVKQMIFFSLLFSQVKKNDSG